MLLACCSFLKLYQLQSNPAKWEKSQRQSKLHKIKLDSIQPALCWLSSWTEEAQKHQVSIWMFPSHCSKLATRQDTCRILSFRSSTCWTTLLHTLLLSMSKCRETSSLSKILVTWPTIHKWDLLCLSNTTCVSQILCKSPLLQGEIKLWKLCGHRHNLATRII